MWIAISYHPYRPLPEQNYAQEVAQFRELLTKYRPGLALWQGECGCPSRRSAVSGWSLEKMEWTEERQAKWLLRRILSDLEQEIALTSYFHTVDLLRYNWGEGPTNFDQSMGLLRGADYTPKPSYFAYQCLCALFDANTRRERNVEIAVEVPAGSPHQPGAISKRFGLPAQQPSKPSGQSSKPDERPAKPAQMPPKPSDKQGKPAIHAVGFQRQGWWLVAYWAAADLFQPWTPQTLSLRLPAGAKPKLAKPVLIDPLRQQVYELPLPAPQEGPIRLANLPLADYPWIITDRQALPGLVGQ